MQLRERTLGSEPLERLLRHRRDVYRQLGGHVLSRRDRLVRLAEELNNDLNGRDDLLCAQARLARELAAERLLPLTDLAEGQLPKAALQLVDSRRNGLPGLAIQTRLPREGLLPAGVLQERRCLGGD